MEFAVHERIGIKIRITQSLKLTMLKESEKQSESRKVFLYEISDKAISTAEQRASDIAPLSIPKSAKNYQTIYFTKRKTLEELSRKWDCSLSTALYTAICCYFGGQTSEKMD